MNLNKKPTKDKLWTYGFLGFLGFVGFQAFVLHSACDKVKGDHLGGL